MEDLVATVKELQRSDYSAKEQWWAYCDAMGGGVRDPAKHDSDFVQTFINRYRAGQRFEPFGASGGGGGGKGGGGGGAGGDSNLGALFKEGQRKSQQWKQCWALYCQSFGGGMNDPEKKDAQFLIGFLDFLGQNGNMDRPVMPTAGGFMRVTSAVVPGMGQPAAKRPRTDGGMAKLPALTSGDSQKDALVQRIKTFQRSGEDAKQQWWTHCDGSLGGIRDPNRHDVDVLQQFAEAYGVPDRRGPV
eukprot:CAMPEP_0113824456 /NCGR_PEP_ID=MMETSP0328-20130328/3251_1 /TAXON_ID=39455 /ORGANISM="Alexandrium minutum" /LENGTH=244 /DNA_ID=CAMNT_0000792395 /DNA_START=96 /DNA_END=828 /DNA_ORIENTATION=+ /assembly_acc=CAM_ASM_000350